MPGVPVVRLLVGVGDGEEVGFREGLTDELHADRQSALADSAGQAHSGQSGQVDVDGEDVAQIHLDRIVGLLADLEGGEGRGRRHQEVDFLEGVLEITADQGANLLSL